MARGKDDLMTATRLGKQLDGKDAAKALPSRLAAAVSGAQLEEVLELPRLGAAVMRLVPHSRVLEIEAAVRAHMDGIGLAELVTTQHLWECERAVRMLAEGVRDPGAARPAFGTLAEWRELDQDLVADLWRIYSDFRERADPVGVDLTDAERAEIERAIVKKNAPLLRSFGCRRLATWLLTTAAPPSTSATPRSSSSDESEETSPIPAPAPEPS